MPAELVLRFNKKELQQLMDAEPDFVIVRYGTEAGVLKDGASVAIIKVTAQTMQKGNSEPLVVVKGCPCPPCVPEEE